MLTFTRDLLNSDYAGHRLTFQLFAQSPPFSHLLAVYNNYDFSEVSSLVRDAMDIATRTEPVVRDETDLGLVPAAV